MKQTGTEISPSPGYDRTRFASVKRFAPSTRVAVTVFPWRRRDEPSAFA